MSGQISIDQSRRLLSIDIELSTICAGPMIDQTSRTLEGTAKTGKLLLKGPPSNAIILSADQPQKSTICALIYA